MIDVGHFLTAEIKDAATVNAHAYIFQHAISFLLL